MKKDHKESFAIPRTQYPTEKDLVEHIKSIGESLVARADELRINTSGCRSIKIQANINPNEEATTVDISLSYFADPRMKKEN